MNTKMMAPLIRLLREETGSSIMNCKKALIACNMNIDKAMKWLKYNTSPVVIMDHPVKQRYDPEKDIVILEKEGKQIVDINNNLDNSEPMKDDRINIKWPMNIKDATDLVFSHNELIALWYISSIEGHVRIWVGEAWALPDEYKDLLILKVFGVIADVIWQSDVINLMVNADDSTPRDIPKKNHDITNCSDTASVLTPVSVNETFHVNESEIKRSTRIMANEYLIETNDGNYYLDTPTGVYASDAITNICIKVFKEDKHE